MVGILSRNSGSAFLWLWNSYLFSLCLQACGSQEIFAMFSFCSFNVGFLFHKHASVGFLDSAAFDDCLSRPAGYHADFSVHVVSHHSSDTQRFLRKSEFHFACEVPSADQRKRVH